MKEELEATAKKLFGLGQEELFKNLVGKTISFIIEKSEISATILNVDSKHDANVNYLKTGFLSYKKKRTLKLTIKIEISKSVSRRYTGLGMYGGGSFNVPENEMLHFVFSSPEKEVEFFTSQEIIESKTIPWELISCRASKVNKFLHITSKEFQS